LQYLQHLLPRLHPHQSHCQAHHWLPQHQQPELLLVPLLVLLLVLLRVLLRVLPQLFHQVMVQAVLP
jgi:hypothetical protein